MKSARQVLAHLVVAEARSLASLALVLSSRRHGVRAGVTGFGYVKGTLTIPMVMVGISVVEVVVLHLLIPWEWLRISLLIATIYSVLFILGLTATSRVMNPHLVGDDSLVLKWGYRTVLMAPLCNVAEVTRSTDYRHSYVAIDGQRLVLTPIAGANVRIRLHQAVAAAAPLPRRQLPADFRPDVVSLYVSDPDAFVAAVRHGIANSEKEPAR